VIAFNGEGLFLEDGVTNGFNLVFGNDADSFTPGPGTQQVDPAFSESLTPLPHSPVRNAGSNARLPADLATDLTGGPRVVGASVDIGAYELPEPTSAPTAGIVSLALAAMRRAVRNAAAARARPPAAAAR